MPDKIGNVPPFDGYERPALNVGDWRDILQGRAGDVLTVINNDFYSVWLGMQHLADRSEESISVYLRDGVIHGMNAAAGPGLSILLATGEYHAGLRVIPTPQYVSVYDEATNYVYATQEGTYHVDTDGTPPADTRSVLICTVVTSAGAVDSIDNDPDLRTYARTHTVGSTAPVSPREGDTWVDTSGTTPAYMIYDSAIPAWQQVAAASAGAGLATTGDGSLKLGTRLEPIGLRLDEIAPPVEGTSIWTSSLEFGPAGDSILYFDILIPDWWTSDKNLELHIDYCMTTSQDANVVLGLKALGIAEGDDYTPAWGPIPEATETVDVEATLDIRDVYTSTVLIIASGVATVGDRFLARLRRDGAAGADTHNGTFVLVDFWFEEAP